MNDRVAIRDFIRKLLRSKDDAADFSDSDPLISSGRLQSFDTLEIVLFLEEKYGIDFAKRGFDQDQLDSVNSIMALIS
jgi:acyl carrier protein